MKKVTALAIALLIAMIAQSALAVQTYAVEHQFSFDYPDSWHLDDATYADASDAYYTWLADVYDDQSRVVIYTEEVDAWLNFTLAGADAEVWADYQRDALASYAGEYVDTLYDQSGEMPFILMRAHPEDVERLYAVTIREGVETVFFLSSEDESSLSEAQESILRQIVQSYQSLE